LENHFDASLKRAVSLRQSVLKEAFAGRLVPQDPNDEPASVLLERIRLRRENPNGPAELEKPKRTRTQHQQRRSSSRSEDSSHGEN
jgi:type I restriction enzyme S subunit